MVNVSDKDATKRTAVAKGFISMKAATLELLESGQVGKGDVLGVARVAGIMAAKRMSELIPMCHTLYLESCSIDFKVHREHSEVEAVCTVVTSGKTGVEMEAVVGVNVALMTIYDMCKSADRAMTMHGIYLAEKHGGKSGSYVAEGRRYEG